MFDRIQTKLTDGLEPIKISVVNNSHKHSGELPGFCEEAARKAASYSGGVITFSASQLPQHGN